MKISDLVNKVDTFRFEYDGYVLEGEWYKYKTTTPQYAKKQMEGVPEVPEDASEEEKRTAQKRRNEALEQVGFKAIADTIVSWNAEDDDGTLLPPTQETFERLPQPFVDKFLLYLKGIREENPSSPSSPNT